MFVWRVKTRLLLAVAVQAWIWRRYYEFMLKWGCYFLSLFFSWLIVLLCVSSACSEHRHSSSCSVLWSCGCWFGLGYLSVSLSMLFVGSHLSQNKQTNWGIFTEWKLLKIVCLSPFKCIFVCSSMWYLSSGFIVNHHCGSKCASSKQYFLDNKSNHFNYVLLQLI